MTDAHPVRSPAGPAAGGVVQHHALDRAGRDAAAAAAASRTHEPVARPAGAAVPRGADPPEVSTEPWIDIPGEVLDVYRLWRPSPLQRAVRLERRSRRPRIYYKYEGVAGGRAKPNTAIAQVHYNKEAGTKRLATETGAGQWGSALAMASKFFGLDCQVFMVKASYEQKPYRRIFMETFGAEVVPSPSPTTQAGKAILEADAESTGSPRDRDQRGDRGRRHLRRRDRVLARIGPEPRPAAPDRDRARGEGADGDRRRPTGRRDRLRGWRIELRRAGLPVHGRPLVRRHPRHPVPRDGARRVPTLTKGRFAYDFADTGQMTPLPDVHARPRSCRRRCTRAGSATTATRRRSRCS